MHLPSDEEIATLIAAAQRYEEPAFDALYQLYADAVFHVFHYRIDDYQTAEDLTSNVFLRVVEALPRFVLPPTGQALAFTTWLFRIAKNQLYDHYRRTKYQPERLDEHLLHPALQDDQIERRTEYQDIREAMTQLTEEQQRVLLLRFVEDLSLADVATITEQSVGSVKSMQRRALHSLGRVLQHVKDIPQF